MQKTHKEKFKTNVKMGTIITGLIGAFVGITVWEMGRKLNREMKEGIKRQKPYDPQNEIYN
jgi:DNA-binding transcriptional regulator WhiA